MRAVIGLLSALAVTGCASYGGTGNSRHTGDYTKNLALSQAAQSVLAYEPPTLPKDAPNDAVLIYLAKLRPADVRQLAVARATATALIMDSDALCERYMSNVMRTARTTTSALSVSSLALSTAAGVTTPVRSANLLSALSSFASGSQTKLTETVLANKAPELLYKAVMAERSRERSRLFTLLESDTLGDSAPAVVMGQISDYHARCGPTVGINSLTDSVQDAAKTAPEKGKTEAKSFVEDLK